MLHWLQVVTLVTSGYIGYKWLHWLQVVTLVTSGYIGYKWLHCMVTSAWLQVVTLVTRTPGTTILSVRMPGSFSVRMSGSLVLERWDPWC